MYGINEAIAAREESTAARMITPFRSEASYMQRARPVLGFAPFEFFFDITRNLLTKIMA